MQYFVDRVDAGKQLAQSLTGYASQNCAVLSLNEGGLVVGAEIAKQVHASLFLLATDSLNVPPELQSGTGLSATGTYLYDNMVSAGSFESMQSDMFQTLDQQRYQAFKDLNRILDRKGEIDIKLLKRHVVIVVADGFTNGFSIDLAIEVLRPIETKRIIVAAPYAHIRAVDRMHILADEIQCLGVAEEIRDTGHYYEKDVVPERSELLTLMSRISLQW